MKRFKPRLVRVKNSWLWAVQVHPEVIELFGLGCVHVCQIKWIDSEVITTQGGLPLDALREIFVASNMSR